MPHHDSLILMLVAGFVLAFVFGMIAVRFKLSPALARAHRRNRGKASTEAEAVAFVEASRRARAQRRTRTSD